MTRRARRGGDVDRKVGFVPHWSQVVLAALLVAAVVALILHAADARRDEARSAVSVAVLRSDAERIVDIQQQALALYDEVDAWADGEDPVGARTALEALDAVLRDRRGPATDPQELVGTAFLAAFGDLRDEVLGPRPDAERAYERAEEFERATVRLSRAYQDRLDPADWTTIAGADRNEERGIRILLIVVVLGIGLGAVTVLRSRATYRAAKVRLDRDREELARATVLERGEAEILAGIVAGAEIHALTVSVLDLAHRLSGGCLSFVASAHLAIEDLPGTVRRTEWSDCPDDQQPSAGALLRSRWSVGTGAVEFGHLELCSSTASVREQPRFDAVVRRCADLIALIIDRSLAEEQLRYRASHDPLTGMPNRARLLEVVEAELHARPASGGTSEVALVFCDLDRFKLVNDSLGHRSGDELLRAVGRRLAAGVEGIGTMVARMGGDEFVAVCFGPEAADRALACAADLSASLQSRFHVGGADLYVTASFGVAVADSSTLTAEELLRNADVAMYAAKRDPILSIVRYDTELEAGLASRLEMDAALREALAADGLTVHLQPLVDVEKGRALGVEALVRWEHDGEVLTPGSFLPVARANGLMGALGRAVVRSALTALASTRGTSPGLSVWINLDRVQLLDRGFASDLMAEVEHAGVEPRCVVLELSEGDLFDLAEIGQVIDDLRSLGIRFAIDDFGSGYSSIVRLTELPVDVVKLDRALVAGLERGGARAEGVLAAAVALVSAAGLDVVVEGVETERELEVVRRLGCRVVQGYLLRRPGPATEVLAELSPSG